MKNNDKLLDFVHEQEPRLMGEPFGRFNIKEECDLYIVTQQYGLLNTKF